MNIKLDLTCLHYFSVLGRHLLEPLERLKKLQMYLYFQRCLSKHLDTWWSGIEIKMAEILSRDDICNYFDLVGNHDDRDLYLFVKTAEHLCTLSYHCKLPTGNGEPLD